MAAHLMGTVWPATTTTRPRCVKPGATDQGTQCVGPRTGTRSRSYLALL